MEEIKVPVLDFQRDFDRYQDMALQQPIAVTDNGRERSVLLSIEEYRRLKRRDRVVLDISEFADEDAEAVRLARPSSASVDFDNELASEA